MTTRRSFIGGLGGAAVVGSRGVWAQQAQVRRVGFFSGGVVDGRVASGPVMNIGLPAFFDELRKRGFSEGNNLALDFRSPNVASSQVAADVNDLIRSK